MDIYKRMQRAYDVYLRRKYWQRIVQAMAVIVVFCTTYALILPAITLESPAVCGFTEHTHTDPCYSLQDPEPCTLPETQGHTHSDACWQEIKSLVCTLEQTAAHTHTDACGERILSCGLDEKAAHTHSDACFRTVTVCLLEEQAVHAHDDSCRKTGADSSEPPACGLEETEGHIHTESCRETQQVCKLEETTGHSHGESCYAMPDAPACGLDETPGHSHDDGCYAVKQELICGLEESEGHSHAEDPSGLVKELICELTEHIHTENCYPAPETQATTEETLPQGDPNADLETRKDWEAGLTAAELTGNPKQDLVNIARTQLGYEESRRNYLYDETGTVLPYTRYGQWIGQPYGHWSGAFVSFCLHYGGVEGFAPAAAGQQLLEQMRAAQCYYAGGQHNPTPGDLIFLDRDGDGSCDFTAIVEQKLPDGTARRALETIPMPGTAQSAEKEADPVLFTGEDGILQVIAGGINGRVDRVCLSVADSAVIGFGVLPEKAEASAPAPHIHEAENGLVTQVQFTGQTDVPQDAKLTVSEISQGSEDYRTMARQITDLLEEEPRKISLLDISFYDPSGDYLPVADTAQVLLNLDLGDADPENIRVFHFVDGTPTELKTVSINQTAAVTMALSEEDDAPPQVYTQLMFETDGFSVFAVVEQVGVNSRVDVTVPSDLAGNTFYIVSHNENYVMTDTPHSNGRGLDKTAYNGPDSLSGQTSWTFLQAEGDTFYIRSNRNLYLVMEDSGTDTANLFTTEDPANATAFTVRAINNQAEIGYDGPNGIAHYLNVFGGHQDFCGWRDNGIQDAGSKVYLHLADADSPLNTVNNLGGQSFAIISNAAQKAISTEATTVNGVPGLQAVAVQMLQSDNTLYYTGDAPVWTFEATGTAGVYHICTEVNGTKQYLRFLDTYYGANSSVSKGSLSLGDTAQDIQVTANSDGSVCLTVKDGTNTGYVNLDQSGSGGFWVYNAMADSNKLLLAEKSADACLVYRLNAPSSTNWLNTPGIAGPLQSVTEEGVLLQTVTGVNAAGTFVYNDISHSSRSDVRAYYNTYNENLGTGLTPENYKAPGAEHRFLGWSATVDGETFCFPENAKAVKQADGIHITDTDGVERTIPYNTILHGQWKKVSDIVMFFVNFGDTMLETQDNKAISNYGSNYYTGVAAIGHIYNETTINPDRNNNQQDVISRYKDSIIQSEIVPVYDPANPGTQIVIDAVAKINATGTGFQFVSVSNYNQSQLEKDVSLYLQNDPNTATQIKIDNAYVDKREITAENYKLYWYLQKPVDSDGWHIDGVLVAKTFPLEIHKTFSGLTGEEAESAINQMQFPLSLINTAGIKNAYTTLTANTSQTGIYTNDGKQGIGNIYKWTLQSIQGQRYAFAETGHLIADHDWSGLVSVHYTDGTVEYKYNTHTTYGTTDLYEGRLVGGTVESVIFANFYTKTGTGAFSISKVVDEAGAIRLQGAEFLLTGVTDSGYRMAAVTNENGAAHFADLEPGIYTLTETKAPEGYQLTQDTWTVTVTKSDSDAVTVTVKKNGSTDPAVTVYDNTSGGIQEVYLIRNTPEDTTVTVNKYFMNIAQSEVQDLTGYCIQVCDNSGTVKNTLTLANATPITGSANAYTWTLNLECDSTYTFVEKNFLHKNYLDTVVAATVNGVSAEPDRTDTDNDGIPDQATLTVQKSDAADTVTISNTYTNTFALKIRKVDATGNRAPIQGVEFNIYGSFSEATGSESLEYVDDNGNKHIAYLIGQTAPTDADGITWYNNMKLSAGTRSFIYVVDEVETPAGYVELDVPIVRMVAVDGENYENGVYTLTVENFKRDLAEVTVTATKQWNIPEGMERPAVKLALYRKASDGAVTRLQEVTLDGTDKTLTESGITATVTGWNVVWQGLTYAADAVRYEYYVSEEPPDAYHVSYSTAITTLQVGLDRIPAAIAEGTNLNRSVTVINSIGYALPETGGSGTGCLWLSGFALLSAAAFLYWKSGRKRQRI